MAQWIVLAANGKWVGSLNPIRVIVVSGRAFDHNCSCAPKTNQSQHPLIKKANSGFLTGYVDERELSTIAHVYLKYDHHIKITAHVSSELHANYKNRFCYYVHNDAYRKKFYIYGLPY